MPKPSVRLLLGVSILAAAGFLIYAPAIPTQASIRVADETKAPFARFAAVTVASPGRIEGQSETMDVGAAIDGVIRSIPVREGQRISRGDVVAELDCQDLQSALPVATAEAESLRQARLRLLHGSRQEERDAAAQRTAGAKAVLTQTAAQFARLKTLSDADAISRSSFDEASRDQSVAEAEYQRAKRNEELVNAGPLAEELAKADADLNAATERIKLAQDKLNKCVVRAPIDGTILRVLLRKGESFSLMSPRPIVTMADMSGRKVRAEVDERDVAKVHLGQRVQVSSTAYSGKTFTGTVTRLSSVMGKKSVLTGDPADKSDRDVLEITAQLEPRATALPVGLRVTVEFDK
jgi:HlyD family secretion protein